MENSKLKSGLIYGLVLLLVAVGGLSYISVKVIGSNHFAPGVEIGGISVQGKNLDEAAITINQAISETYATRIAFYKEDYKYETKLGDLCLPIDARQVVQSAWQAEKARSWLAKIVNLKGKQKVVYPVDIAYDPEIKNKLAEEWNAKWGMPAKNASIEMNSQGGISVVPSRAGMGIDAEATFSTLPAQIDKSKGLTFPIRLKNQEPQITEAQLSNMGQLSQYTTNYDLSLVNRSHNLSMAAATIDKSMVAPHAVFSFNSTLGQCTVEKGYLDAMVIVSGKFEPGLAGGICQVSSTLYNASLLAGMDILERRNHSLAVTYVPLGRDATVSNGSQDFRFSNNTDYPIYIRAAASGGRLTIRIYGNTQYKKKIEISNIIDQTLDYTTVIEQDPKLNPGEEKVDHNGQLGYVVRSFRTFYGENGKITKTEQLGRDTYDPLNKLIYRGPELDPVHIPDTVPPPPVVDDGDPDPNIPGHPGEPITPENRNHIRP